MTLALCFAYFSRPRKDVTIKFGYAHRAVATAAAKIQVAGRETCHRDGGPVSKQLSFIRVTGCIALLFASAMLPIQLFELPLTRSHLPRELRIALLHAITMLLPATLLAVGLLYNSFLLHFSLEELFPLKCARRDIISCILLGIVIELLFLQLQRHYRPDLLPIHIFRLKMIRGLILFSLQGAIFDGLLYALMGRLPFFVKLIFLAPFEYVFFFRGLGLNMPATICALILVVGLVSAVLRWKFQSLGAVLAFRITLILIQTAL